LPTDSLTVVKGAMVTQQMVDAPVFSVFQVRDPSPNPPSDSVGVPGAIDAERRWLRLCCRSSMALAMLGG
jgi:hypothetical protein